MKKRFLMLFISGLTLTAIVLFSLSCVSHDQCTTGNDWTSWDEQKFKEFITVDALCVAECLEDINPIYGSNLTDQPTQDGFDDIRDWVAANIEYRTDEEQWDVNEYWQTPEETLSLRTGDCEDFAILLCTLLRAYGIGEEHIYVAVGIDNDGYGHAFLLENWYLNGEWRALEPQMGSQTFPPGRRFKDYSLTDFKLLRDYEIILGFNDCHYYDESFPWDEV